MKLKPYPEYKDSGVPWFGKVPGHWDLRKIKYLFNERVQKGFPNEPLLVASQTKGVILKTNYENRTVVVQKDFHLLKLVKKGDFVISLRSFQGGIELAHCQGIISPAYTIMVPKEVIHNGYFKHLAKSNVFIELLKTCVTGIREGQNIDYEILKRNRIPLPSIVEQHQISRFLDFKSSQISRFIRAKKRIIELLKEQKQAIINQAVTRGLDPNVKFKPSGVEWLGEIPEHWDVRFFSKISRVFRGASPRPAADPRFFHGDFIPWLTVGDITKDENLYLSSTETFLTELGCKNSRVIDEGSLVLTNSGATLGVPKILNFKVCANDGIVAFKDLSKSINPLFAYYFLSSLTKRLREELRQGGTQPNLNTTMVKMLPCPIPPYAEQNSIIKNIENKIYNIHSAISRTEREITLMQEYRTRLIADVVTGKVDVRDIPVPDVTDEEIICDAAEDAEEDQSSDDETTGNPEECA